MGGKHKQAQRTKNNVRPSSSGRSAALLGNVTPNFSGFSTVKEMGNVSSFPTLSLCVTDELDPSIDSNFQLVLKKMNKKDSITKLKALQEFAELIENAEPEAVKAVLPFWPRLYCLLAVDLEHRVREAAHQAHRAVVKSAKRNIAPYLRQLAGPWFISQYDTYPPAATAAAQSFQDAFPRNKFTEAIVFCQHEILNYIIENITVQTAQSLGNPKSSSSEDMEAKYQRVLVSSLQGFASFVQKIPMSNLETVEENIKKFLSHKRFWKLASNKLPLIRNAWFSVVIAICQKCPKLLVEETGNVSLAVLGNLDESDPIVLPTVWEAALHLLTTMEDCWSHVNAEKIVFPKLWHVLRQGGEGNAVTIFPNLLPFVSKIPATASLDKDFFYNKFFTSMHHGLKQKPVQQSTSECQAVAKSYMECLRYLISIYQPDQAFCESLVSNHLVGAVELAIVEPKLHSEMIFEQVSLLIHHWSRNHCQYDPLLNIFWKSIFNIFTNLLLTGKEMVTSQNSDIEQKLKQFVKFLTCMKSEPKTVCKGPRVKFISDEVQDLGKSNDSKSITYEDSVDTLEMLELQSLVEDVAVMFFNIFKDQKNNFHLNCLSNLVAAFNFKSLFSKIARVDKSEDETEQFITLFEENFYPWLLNELTCVVDVVNLIFSLMQHLPDQRRLDVIHHLCKVHDPNGHVLIWTLEAVLDNCSFKIFQQFLRSQELNKILVSLAHEMFVGSVDNKALYILKRCVSSKTLEDPFISNEALFAILNELESMLLVGSIQSKHLTVAKQITMDLYNRDLNLSPFVKKSESALGFLLFLFKISCRRIVEDKEDGEISEAWNLGVSALSKAHGIESQEFKKIFNDFCTIVSFELFNRDCDCSYALVENTIKLITSASNCFKDIESASHCCNSAVLLCSLVLSACASYCSPWESYFKSLCMYAEQLQGLVFFEIVNDCYTSPIDTDKILGFSKFMLFVGTFINKLFQTLKLDNDSDDENNEPFFLSKCENFIHLRSFILQMFHYLALLDSFQNNYKNTLCYNKLINNVTTFNLELVTLMTTHDISHEEIFTSLMGRAEEKGDFWIWAMFHSHQFKCTGEDAASVCIQFIESVGLDSKLAIQAEQIYLCLSKIKSLKLPKSEEVNPVFWLSSEDSKNHEKLSALHIDKNLKTITCWLNLGGPIFTSIDESIKNFILEIHQCYRLRRNTLLISNIATYKGSEVQKIVEQIMFLSKLPPWHIMEKNVWDFTLIALTYWIQTMQKEIKVLLEEKLSSNVQQNITVFSVATCQLFRAVHELFQEAENSENEIYKEKSYSELLEEWKVVFSVTIYESLVELLKTLADCEISQPLSADRQILLENISKALVCVDTCHYFERCDLPSIQETLMKNCAKLIYSPINTLQLVAFHMLKMQIPRLAKLDAVCTSDEDPELKGVEFLHNLLQDGEAVVNTALLDLRIGDCCLMEPFTDAHTYSTAYLMVWSLLLDLCAEASPQIRYQYAARSSTSESLKHLLQNIFRLMPEEVLTNSDSKVKHQMILFSNTPSLKISEASSADDVKHLACWVYYSVLQRLPAMVRQWWNDAEQRVANMVERVTTTYVSPLLCMQELSAIQHNATNYQNMQVKVHVSVREVVALYTVDEARMELVVKMPNNHPLGLIKVDSGQNFVCSSQWRNWMMQLTIFLTHQNGSLWDGLMLLKSNLDKHFEGVEECYICFSILHGSNFQLPKLCCKTCKKKFHSPCLYKWFSTSNKSTCPICRNIF